MYTISTTSDLKNAIQQLEVEQAHEKQLLKERFLLLVDSIKPINLIKSTLHDVATTPNLMKNILGTTMGIGTGYLSKKIVVGGSGNIIRKVFGSILQFAITRIVAQHPETIKSIGEFVFKSILRKKKASVTEPDKMKFQ